MYINKFIFLFHSSCFLFPTWISRLLASLAARLLQGPLSSTVSCFNIAHALSALTSQIASFVWRCSVTTWTACHLCLTKRESFTYFLHPDPANLFILEHKWRIFVSAAYYRGSQVKREVAVNVLLSVILYFFKNICRTCTERSTQNHDLKSDFSHHFALLSDLVLRSLILLLSRHSPSLEVSSLLL